MAVDEVTNWFTTTTDNPAPIPPGPDGRRPRRVGLSMQEMMASIARWRDTLSGVTGTILLSGTDPRLSWNETDATADNKYWDILPVAEQLRFRAVNDAQNVFTNWLTVDRTGTVIDAINFAGPITVADNLTLESTTPELKFYETDGPTDEKRYRFRSLAGNFVLSLYDDSDVFIEEAISFVRSVDHIDRINFFADTARFGRLGQAGIMASVVSDQSLVFTGGVNSSEGSKITLYGISHPSRALDTWFAAGANLWQRFDEDAGQWQISTGAGSKTLALNVDASQDSTFYGSILALAGTTAKPSIRIPTGVAPSSPTQGDMWVTASDAFVRLNGVSESIIGGGDVTKVGTPVDNQVGIWTGDGTLEGDTFLTLNSKTLGLVSSSTWGSLYTVFNLGFATALTVLSSGALVDFNLFHNAYDDGITAYKYAQSGAALRYSMLDSGSHRWYTAVDGATGADPITWLEAFRINQDQTAIFFSDLDVQGTFTSLGIDVTGDIAASEAIESKNIFSSFLLMGA